MPRHAVKKVNAPAPGMTRVGPKLPSAIPFTPTTSANERDSEMTANAMFGLALWNDTSIVLPTAKSCNKVLRRQMTLPCGPGNAEPNPRIFLGDSHGCY